MNTFQYTEKLAKIFTSDAVLRECLKIENPVPGVPFCPERDKRFSLKFRRRDQEVDEFEIPGKKKPELLIPHINSSCP